MAAHVGAHCAELDDLDPATDRARHSGASRWQATHLIDSKSDNRAMPQRSSIFFEDTVAGRMHRRTHPCRRVVGKALVDLGHDFRLVRILNDDVCGWLVDRFYGFYIRFDQVEIQVHEGTERVDIID